MIEPIHGDRRLFARLIDGLKYKIGAEIGVRYGHFSKYLLGHSELSLLYSIDPWNWNEENDDPDASYRITQENLEPFGNRSKMIKAKNEDVLHLFDTETFDFVYLDALHDYESVKRDIENWWKRLRVGGCLAGHDYHEGDWPGVVRAVKEHTENEGLQIFTTDVGDTVGETDGNKKSWFVFKGRK